MFEHKTFESILQEMLDRVPDDVDKRIGAVIYDALAPTAMELAETYSDLDLILRLTFADTADGDFLERRVNEHGVYRDMATAAIRKGVFTDSSGLPFNVPIGSRYRLNDVVYLVTERIEPGAFRMTAETVGVDGNKDFGDMLPVEPVDNLGRAELATVLVPGEDEESDEALYAKFLLYINEQPFGGNRADYTRKIMSINGVGGVKLFRTPQGGGTVTAIIIGSDFNPPEPDLVEMVQTLIDPEVNQGDGIGLAPIGHTVTIKGVEEITMDVETTLTLNGVTIGQVQPLIEDVIKEYLTETRKMWSGETNLVVRVSQIESRILDVVGIQDISGTTLTGLTENLVLSEIQVPSFGSVTLHE